MTEQTANPMREAIAQAISDNPVILFMKGNPDAPACGFSARTVAILESMGAKFAAVDEQLRNRRPLRERRQLLTNPRVGQDVDGELVGGADIVSEMYQSGELAETLGTKVADDAAELETAAVDQAPLSIENRLS
jgi:monothiol glutaredoxin